jgi:hypothetical protein
MEMPLLYLPKPMCVLSPHMHFSTAIPPHPALGESAWAMLSPLQQNDITETNNRSNPGIRDKAAHVNTPSTLTGEGKVRSNAVEMLMIEDFDPC